MEELNGSVIVGAKLSPEAVRERFKSINMLGKICSSMMLKRASFLLAIGYLDKFLDGNMPIDSIKAITIASLLIALKFEHALEHGNLVYQFSGVPTAESRTKEA